MQDRPKEWVSLDPLTTMLLATGGFTAGIGLMLVGYRSGNSSVMFVHSYSGKLWLGLIGVQTAFWAVAFVPLWSALRLFYQGFREELRGSLPRIVVFDILFIALLFAAPYLARSPVANPLAGHHWKIAVVTLAAGAMIGLPALTGMFAVRVASHASRRQDVRNIDGTRYLILRQNLQQFLRIAGATIALATLATGALRQAVLANGAKPETFPPEVVLAFGAFLTAVLSLAYIPAFLSLRTAGRDLLRRLLPMPTLGSAVWFEWESKRKTLSEFLQLDQSMFDRIQASLFILAPLLSAAVSLAIPKQS